MRIIFSSPFAKHVSNSLFFHLNLRMQNIFCWDFIAVVVVVELTFLLSHLPSFKEVESTYCSYFFIEVVAFVAVEVE